MTLVEVAVNIAASVVASLYMTRRFVRMHDADRKKQKAFEASISPPAAQAPNADAPYRSAEIQPEQKPVVDEALATQTRCPKRNNDRALFGIVYHESTDRLHVQCGTKLYTRVEEFVNGCGAKWIELPARHAK